MPVTANVVDQTGTVTGTHDLDPEVFEGTVNVPVMHQALVRQLANGRQGSTRAPQYEGGGVVFGPHPRGYTQGMPRKMRRLALRSALTVKAEAGEIVILESFELEAPRTRAVVELLQGIEAGSRVLLVLGSHNEVLERSARNLPQVRVLLASNLNVRDLLSGDTVVMTRDALEHLGEVLSGGWTATEAASPPSGRGESPR